MSFSYLFGGKFDSKFNFECNRNLPSYLLYTLYVNCGEQGILGH